MTNATAYMHVKLSCVFIVLITQQVLHIQAVRLKRILENHTFRQSSRNKASITKSSLQTNCIFHVALCGARFGNYDSSYIHLIVVA